MTSETKTVFGEVLGELMEARGIPSTPGNMFELASEAGLDPETFMARVAGDHDPDRGHLRGLAKRLELSETEEQHLALAYTFERRG